MLWVTKGAAKPILTPTQVSPRVRAVLFICLAVVPAALQPVPARGEGGRVLELEYLESFEPHETEEIVGELFGDRPVPEARYTIDAYIVRYSSYYPRALHAAGDAADEGGTAAEHAAAEPPAGEHTAGDGAADATGDASNEQEGGGHKAVITAQLFVPRRDEPSPLYLFAPGTTGLVDACRPSREHIVGIHWGLYRAHVLAFVGKGFIGLLPDYTGFGEADRLQPVFHARSEAKMMLDGVRAVAELGAGDEFPPSDPERVYLAGFSQGGHAAFAAAEHREEYAPEIEIAGIVGYGPTTDMPTLFREFPVVAPMVVKIFGELYGADRFPAEPMLQTRWREDLERHVTRQCIGGMQSFYPWSARELFREEFADALFGERLEQEFPEIYRIMRRNSPGLIAHGVPAFILQGSDDIVISPESQERFVHALREAGSEVRYELYEGARHDTRQVGFDDVLEWIGGQK